MKNNNFEKPVEIWINEDFLLPGIRPMPLLMNMALPDTNPELEFWNLLRDKLQVLISCPVDSFVYRLGFFEGWLMANGRDALRQASLQQLAISN